MTKKKLFVFDWDGTLEDSKEAIYKAKCSAAKLCALKPPSFRKVSSVIGLPFDDAMNSCFPNIDSFMLEKVKQLFKEKMCLNDYSASLFPKVKETLLYLKKNQKKLAIATAKSKKELTSRIAYHGIEDYFDIICTGDAYPNKPQPEMLKHIMNHFNISPCDTLMIGDTATDIDFAKNAKVDPICIMSKLQSKRMAIETQKGVFLLETWLDFVKLVDKYV